MSFIKKSIILITMIISTSCSKRETLVYDHCELHGEKLIYRESYKGKPPTLTPDMEAFMFIADSSKFPHVEEVWMVSDRDSPEAIAKVQFTQCPTCQNLHNKEFTRISSLPKDELSKELDKVIKKMHAEKSIIPDLNTFTAPNTGTTTPAD